MQDMLVLRTRVSVRDALTALGYQVPVRGNRMPCPIHGGTNKQAFAIRGNYFRCWNCEAKGDVVALVQALLKSDFPTALAYVSRLAGFPAGKAPRVAMAEAKRRMRALREKREAEEVRDRRLLECADRYRDLTKQAKQVGAALAKTDDDGVWDALDKLYTERDSVEALEASLKDG